MATKKSASVAKKTTSKKSTAAAKTTPKKAVKAPAAAAKPETTVTATVKTTAASATRKRFSFSRSPLLAASIAEFVGTFVLAALVLATNGSSIVVLFGLITIVLMIGAISGAHANPAITIGAWVTRRIKTTRAVSYLVAQVLGALLALVVINAFVTSAPEPAATSQSAMYGQPAAVEIFKLGDLTKGKEWLILAAELIGTAFFAFGVAATTLERNRMAAAFAVGGSLFVGLTLTSYLNGLVTGLAAQGSQGSAVLNPAVAVALQGISLNAWPIAVYVLAPAIGAVLGFALRDLLRSESEAAA